MDRSSSHRRWRFRWPWHRSAIVSQTSPRPEPLVNKLFISYSSTDRQSTVALAAKLVSVGYDVWCDQQLVGGHPWWNTILQAIQDADLFVFALTPASLDSAACHEEFTYAHVLRKRILPVMLIAVNLHLLPEALQVIQVVDYRQQNEEEWTSLHQALGALPVAQPLPDPLPPPPPVPLSPLGRINEQFHRGRSLRYEEQAAIMLELKCLLADPDSATEARTLLQTLHDRYDVLAVVASEIQTILGQNDTPRPMEPTDQGAIALNISTLPPGKGHGSGWPFRYLSSLQENVLTITPQIDYLDKVWSGQLVPAVSSYHSGWDLPALDIKVVNNTARTLFFTEAVFRVIESIPDPTTILLVISDQEQTKANQIEIANDGWSPAYQVTMSFDLLPFTSQDPSVDADHGFLYTLELGDIEKRQQVDLTVALQHRGVHTDAIQEATELLLTAEQATEALATVERDNVPLDPAIRSELERQAQAGDAFRRQHFGPFFAGKVLVSGILQYRGATAETPSQEFQTRFSTTLYLVKHSAPAARAMMISQHYDALLQLEGRDYQVHVPISQVVKAGEADRFGLQIAAPRSSLHRFTLDFLYNDGEHISSVPLALHLFAARSNLMGFDDLGKKLAFARDIER